MDLNPCERVPHKDKYAVRSPYGLYFVIHSIGIVGTRISSARISYAAAGRNMSKTRTPNAAMIHPEPSRPPSVTALEPAPKKISAIKTRTMVSRFPTLTTIGPHTFSSTCKKNISAIGEGVRMNQRGVPSDPS